MTDYRQFYIDGQWVDPQRPQDCPVINPATGQRIAVISLGGPADVDRAVAAARRAFATYSQTTVAERIALISRVLEVYRSRQDEIGAAISDEMGAPLAFARRSQAGIGAGHLATILEVLQTFPFSEEREWHAAAARTGRCLRLHHAVELADEPDRLQGRAGAGRRLHDGAEAERDRAAVGAACLPR